jgi:AcrR family transcriptional regulator
LVNYDRAGMPRPIPADRFQSLIGAATAVFLEQGYRRTQVADVAARMGVAKGSVYTYVESKEALFDCVVRLADRAGPIELPAALPVVTPPAGATLAELKRRLARERVLPTLDAALARSRVADVHAELTAIATELYDALARNRTGIKLLDRCAFDHPELANVWYRVGRDGVLAPLARYLDDRIRRGRVRRIGNGALAARIVLETLVFWAVHRHWDPSPQDVDERSARQAALAFVTAALVKEPR